MSIEDAVVSHWPVIERRYRRHYGDQAQDIAQQAALLVLAYHHQRGVSGDPALLMGRIAACVVSDLFRRSGPTLLHETRWPVEPMPMFLKTAAGFDVALETSDLLDFLRADLTQKQRAALDLWASGEELGRNRGREIALVFRAVRHCRLKAKAESSMKGGRVR